MAMNIVENALDVLERAGHDVEVEDNIIYVDGEEITPAEAIGAALSIRSMGELSERQRECKHSWSFAREDLITGNRTQDCHDCGARRQLPSPKGSPAWKAQMMLKYEKLESCTLGEAEKWFTKNKVKMQMLEGYRA